MPMSNAMSWSGDQLYVLSRTKSNSADLAVKTDVWLRLASRKWNPMSWKSSAALSAPVAGSTCFSRSGATALMAAKTPFWISSVRWSRSRLLSLMTFASFCSTLTRNEPMSEASGLLARASDRNGSLEPKI